MSLSVESVSVASAPELMPYVEIGVWVNQHGQPWRIWYGGHWYKVSEIVHEWESVKPWIAGRPPVRRRVFWVQTELGLTVVHHDVENDVWRLERVLEQSRV